MNRPRSRAVLVVVALTALLGVWGSGAAAVAPRPPAPPSSDPFYQPPSPLPDGRPGDVVRFRRVTVYAEPSRTVPLPAAAWQVLYRSTSALGQPNVVSGTVLVPLQPWGGDGPRPVVGYAVGTHGLGDQCAPSYQLVSGREQELSLFGQALARGWAVAISDYERLGTPGDHTYVVGQSEGRAVLDVVRAAGRLADAGLSAAAPVGVWGYSQGGGAAVFAGELAAGYAPELRLKGTAAGGVPADLLREAEFLDGSPFAGFLVAAGVGFNSAYPELRIEDLLNDAGRAAFAEARDDCTDQLLAHFQGRRIAELSSLDLLRYPPVQARLAENAAGSVGPAAPVRLYHGDRDQIVPYELGQDLFADYCQLGVQVQLDTVTGADHTLGAIAGAPVTVGWLSDRFAGRAAPTSC